MTSRSRLVSFGNSCCTGRNASLGTILDSLASVLAEQHGFESTSHTLANLYPAVSIAVNSLLFLGAGSALRTIVSLAAAVRRAIILALFTALASSLMSHANLNRMPAPSIILTQQIAVRLLVL